jgi:hypothetical protein
MALRKVVGITHGDVLRGKVACAQREGVNRGAIDIADKQDVAGSKRQDTGGL